MFEQSHVLVNCVGVRFYTDPIYKDIWEDTLDRNHLLARFVILHFQPMEIYKDIYDYTQEKNHFLIRFTIQYFPLDHISKNTCDVTLGEKPYSCDICKSTFLHGSGLKIHRRTHIVGKPYCWEDCGLVFADSSTLEEQLEHTHVRNHFLVRSV